VTHYTIKEATVDDIVNFKRFLVKAWHEAEPDALGWSGASDEQIEEITSDAFLSSLITRSGTRIFLANTRDEIIGFSTNTKIDDTVTELSGIIILESMTGHGVGTAILQSAISRAVSDGVTRLAVKTERANNRAIQFYQNHGFRIPDVTTSMIGAKSVELVKLELTLS
jgi:GNAT superfamily N-acetyltransferase